MFKLGDLVIVQGRGFFSHIIEDVTDSSYSHVAIIVNQEQVIEAMGLKRTGYQTINFYRGQDVFTCPLLTEIQRQQIVNFLINQIGTHYDYLLLFWELIRYGFHVLFPYTEDKKYICSTLAADAYKVAGVNLTPKIKYPSPADIANSKLLTKIGSL